MQISDRFKNLFRPRPKKEKTIFKKDKEFNTWIFQVVKSGMVESMEKAENMSIWKLCEILDYLALESDKEISEIKKNNKK